MRGPVARYQSQFPYRPPGMSLARADTAQELSNVLGNFRQRAEAFGSARQAQRGAVAGAEAGLQGPPQKKSSLTAYGRSFNTAAGNAYLAQQNIDIEDNLSRIEEEALADPVKYEELSNGFIKGMVKGAPSELRPNLELLARARQVDGRRRVTEQFTLSERDRQRAVTREGLDVMIEQARRLASSQDPESEAALAVLQDQIGSTLVTAVNEKLYSAQEAYELKAHYQDKLSSTVSDVTVDNEVSAIMGAYHSDVLKGDKLLAALDAAPYDDATKTKIRADVRARVNLLQDERKRLHVQDLAALHKDIADGVPSADAEQMAFRLYRRGAMETGGYTSMVSAITNARESAAKKEAGMEAARMAFDNGYRLDPKDSDARKAMDALFADQIAGVPRGSPEYQNVATEMARRTNIIPSDSVSWARTVIAAGDVEGAAAASNFLAKVSAANPMAFGYIEDAKLKSFAEQVNAAVESGAPAELAVQVAHKNTYELKPAEEEMYKAGYRGLSAAKFNPAILQNALNSDDRYDRSFLGMGGAPQAPPAMTAEFESSVQRYFPYVGGDIEKARALAWRDVQATWGYSTVNGVPEMKKYAPEVMYPGVTSEIIRKDIDAAVPGALLIESNETGRTQGQIWNLGALDEYGAVNVILGEDNRPVRYRIPVEGEAFSAAKESLAAEKVQAARDLSARQKKQIEILTEMATAGDEEAARLVGALRATRN